MFVNERDPDGFNLPLSICKNGQRSAIFMSYPSSVEIPNCFDLFRFAHLFHTLLHTISGSTLPELEQVTNDSELMAMHRVDHAKSLALIICFTGLILCYFLERGSFNI